MTTINVEVRIIIVERDRVHRAVWSRVNRRSVKRKRREDRFLDTAQVKWQSWSRRGRGERFLVCVWYLRAIFDERFTLTLRRISIILLWSSHFSFQTIFWPLMNNLEVCKIAVEYFISQIDSHSQIKNSLQFYVINNRVSVIVSPSIVGPRKRPNSCPGCKECLATAAPGTLWLAFRVLKDFGALFGKERLEFSNACTHSRTDLEIS